MCGERTVRPRLGGLPCGVGDLCRSIRGARGEIAESELVLQVAEFHVGLGRREQREGLQAIADGGLLITGYASRIGQGREEGAAAPVVEFEAPRYAPPVIEHERERPRVAESRTTDERDTQPQNVKSWPLAMWQWRFSLKIGPNPRGFFLMMLTGSIF